MPQALPADQLRTAVQPPKLEAARAQQQPELVKYLIIPGKIT
jgi:hypothetical protein